MLCLSVGAGISLIALMFLGSGCSPSAESTSLIEPT